MIDHRGARARSTRRTGSRSRRTRRSAPRRSCTSAPTSSAQRYVPLLASGKVLGGFGLTEPDAGSDAGGTQTTAVRRGDCYVLNGTKRFITHGSVGEIFVVTAVTDPSQGTKGISSFIVTKPTSDLEKAKRARHRPRAVASRDAGLPRRQEGGQARLARVGHGRAHHRGRRGPGGEPARRARGRASSTS